MHIFNADGQEAEQCGNAIRCVARYADERLGMNKKQMQIETQRGIQTVWIQENDEIRVDMGAPILQSREIPVRLDLRQVVMYPLEIKGESFRVTCVSMGNPHAIIEVDDITKVPLERWGPQIETHPLFPQKTNVEFVSIHTPEEITMRVWERGVGITQACGSGACAAVVAGNLWGKLTPKVTVRLDGGSLAIHWDQPENGICMTGPASFVFEGDYVVT
jgi:diaminopimelate epimerase